MSSTACNRLRTLAFAAVVALAGGAAACGDGAGHSTPQVDAAVDGGPGTPAVLLTERVFTPSGRQYVLSVLPDVPSAAVDRSTSTVLDSADVELFDGKVYVRDRVANTMTRYQVTEDRKLKMDGQFSFATLGLGANRYSDAFVSADRAYLMDSTDWRLIGWNPTTMALTGEVVSIAGMKKDPALTGSISPAVMVGTRLVAAINWEDFTNLVMFPGSGLLVIDPAAPGTPAFIQDARVGGGFRVTATASGDAYLTGTVGGDVRKFGSAFGGGTLPASGIVKLAAGQGAFDASYLVDVEAITQTKAVGAIHRIDDTTLLAQIYDPALELPATLNDFRASTNFEFVLIDTVNRTFTPVASLPKGGQANAGNHVVDGKLYIQLSNATGSVAYAVSAAGVTQAFPVPAGDVWFLARIR
jgi:Domain of unknown function (DUF4374)